MVCVNAFSLKNDSIPDWYDATCCPVRAVRPGGRRGRSSGGQRRPRPSRRRPPTAPPLPARPPAQPRTEISRNRLLFINIDVCMNKETDFVGYWDLKKKSGVSLCALRVQES